MSNKIHQMVTDTLVELLEQGKNPWKRTWKNIADFGKPFNLSSKRGYSGSNIVMLGYQDVDCPAWVTFKQCKDLGGNVKKGAKSTVVTFWMFKNYKDETTGKEKTIPFLRYYRVFNALRDCEGLEEKVEAIKGIKIDESVPAEAIDMYLKREEIKLSHGGGRAFYSPSQDRIQMPHEQSFTNRNEYQGTLAHEAIHSTGHSDRLNRLRENASFGSIDYSLEELVAETGSCILCAEIGVEPDFRNSAAYLQGWARKLKENTSWFVVASGKASKAVDYILDRKKQEKKS